MRNLNRFTFPDSTTLIDGGRRTGKTTKCAKFVVDALLDRRSVLAILPTQAMQDVFVNQCHTEANERSIVDMKYFGLDVYVLKMSQWAPPKERKIYDLIVFVDGPDDDRNPQFHGHQSLFNIPQNLWAVLDYHAEHYQYADSSRPKFVVACNEWNLRREAAQIWIEDFNGSKQRREPEFILRKMAELRLIEADVAGIIASKLLIHSGG